MGSPLVVDIYILLVALLLLLGQPISFVQYERATSVNATRRLPPSPSPIQLLSRPTPSEPQ